MTEKQKREKFSVLKEEITTLQTELNKKRHVLYTEEAQQKISDWERTRIPLEFATEIEKIGCFNAEHIFNFPFVSHHVDSFYLRNEDLISIIRRLKTETKGQ